MGLRDKLAERRRKKGVIGKLMRKFKKSGHKAGFARASARRLAQVKAIKKLLALIKKQDAWPESMIIDELFINDNGLRNHVHIASRERDKLLILARIAQKKYSAGDSEAVREFPPFNSVECVHTSSSWHYRDSSSPDTPRACPNIGDGLAFDLRSAQSSREAFAHEVARRYNPSNRDF